MAKISIYFDRRRLNAKGEGTLRLCVNHLTKTAFVTLDLCIEPHQWDNAAQVVVAHPRRNAINSLILRRLAEANELLENLKLETPIATFTAAQLRDLINEKLFPERSAPKPRNTFWAKFLAFADSKKTTTRGVYMQTARRLQAFDKDVEKLRFEDITKEYLTRFDNFMAQTAPSRNARNIHLRNIRAVFNDAIDDEITHHYPFRKFKIRPIATAKRSLTVEELRRLFHFTPEPYAQQYLDMFKLTFYLIGINLVDLSHLTTVSNGRIEYHRAKTNRFYSIKIEPEAAELIDKYRGKGKYLLNILDHCQSHLSYLSRLNKELKRLGDVHRVGLGGRKIRQPLFPQLSTYWARHTWATIAAQLDIPKETIAAALGHGGNTVTDIYIDFDRRKIDEANRKVISFVLDLP